ncbi:hypothetical protein RJT34_28523 [Clitoria ternatea]|uniref:Uncharacterized protein n=1 Tax=Clitoria ternatea TaxID=43366 RepID=A0AAN9FDF9_CLITE
MPIQTKPYLALSLKYTSWFFLPLTHCFARFRFLSASLLSCASRTISSSQFRLLTDLITLGEKIQVY